MNTIEDIKNSKSKSFQKRNPHLFQQVDEQIAFLDRVHRENYLEDQKKHSGKTVKKRIRQSGKPLLNNLEQEFYDQVACLFSKEIPLRKQAIKFRLANGAFYKPDLFAFACGSDKRPQAYEVKELRGKNVDRGKLALKVAATTWPEVRFHLAWKENGQWQTQEVLP